MYKYLHALLTLTQVLVALAALAPAAVAGDEPEITLEDAFADAFRVGAALNRGQIMGEEPATLALVARQFNTLTAENVSCADLAPANPGLGVRGR